MCWIERHGWEEIRVLCSFLKRNGVSCVDEGCKAPREDTRATRVLLMSCLSILHVWCSLDSSCGVYCQRRNSQKKEWNIVVENVQALVKSSQRGYWLRAASLFKQSTNPWPFKLCFFGFYNFKKILWLPRKRQAEQHCVGCPETVADFDWDVQYSCYNMPGSISFLWVINGNSQKSMALINSRKY